MYPEFADQFLKNLELTFDLRDEKVIAWGSIVVSDYNPQGGSEVDWRLLCQINLCN